MRDELKRAHVEVARLRQRVEALERALVAAGQNLRPYLTSQGNGPVKTPRAHSDSGEPIYDDLPAC